MTQEFVSIETVIKERKEIMGKYYIYPYSYPEMRERYPKMPYDLAALSKANDEFVGANGAQWVYHIKDVMKKSGMPQCEFELAEYIEHLGKDTNFVGEPLKRRLEEPEYCASLARAFSFNILREAFPEDFVEQVDEQPHDADDFTHLLTGR